MQLNQKNPKKNSGKPVWFRLARVWYYNFKHNSHEGNRNWGRRRHNQS